MSRNFELLQNLGRPLDVFTPEDEQPLAQAEPRSSEFAAETVADVSVHAPALRLEDGERDEVTRLVSRVFLSGGMGPRQVVWMGADAGTGCSRICARAADVLASTAGTQTVCAVDANLRTPTLHQHFGIENHFGLADALQQGGSIRRYARHLAGNRLSVITAGAALEGWQMLLGSPQMQTRMSELHREFDYVLVDIPPLKLYPEAAALAKMSDGLILIVKAHATRRETAQKVVSELKAANVPVLGAILNDRTFPVPEAIYKRL